MTDINLSEQQAKGVKAAETWFAERRKQQQVFKLRGFAGSGKTTLAIRMAQELKVVNTSTGFARRARVGFAAFTGKAALVMQRKGCVNAQTIHSLIYKVTDVDELDAKGQPTGNTVPMFTLNHEDSPLLDMDCLFIDECSMVGEELARDLLSFDVPILALGDPGQLPPIKDTGYFDSGPADFMLTEIHRQALDNPIIRMSMNIRTGKGVPKGRYGDSRVISKKEVIPSVDYRDHQQILCGRNATRHQINAHVRSLLGFDLPAQPMQGEKLICLRNDREKGLLNGSLWTVNSPPTFDGKYYDFLVQSLDSPERYPFKVHVPLEFFSTDEEARKRAAYWRCDQFDWAYALTVHKSQGSQWPTGLIINENYCFREHAVNWLYTAVTRMSDSLTLAV